MGKIMVIAEVSQGKIRKTTLSALTFAQQLSKAAGKEVFIALIGEGLGGVSKEAALYSKVVVVDHPELKVLFAQSCAKVIADLVEKTGTDFVVAASSTSSRDVLPRVAGRLNAGMVSEVLAIAKENPLQFKRPMWAGNVIATVEVKTPRAVFTVRASEFTPIAPASSPYPIEEIKMDIEPYTKARFVRFDQTISLRPELTEASVVVAGGRGLKDKEGFKILEPLADLFNAAIGGTRAVVDAGILPNDLQIGQTGKVVAPNLYFAIGISGAIQHIAGMKNSKVIVAINKDPDAPIFSVADYGLVADAFKSVPELVEEVKKVKK